MATAAAVKPAAQLDRGRDVLLLRESREPGSANGAAEAPRAEAPPPVPATQSPTPSLQPPAPATIAPATPAGPPATSTDAPTPADPRMRDPASPAQPGRTP